MSSAVTWCRSRSRRDRSVAQYLEPFGAAPPEQGADAGEELVEPERLRQVVISAGIESPHDVLDRVARGQHEDRRVASFPPQLLRDLESGFLRQHDIQQDHVILVNVRQHGRLGAVGGDVDHIPFLLQALLDEARDLPVVFHQEHFHGAFHLDWDPGGIFRWTA